MRFWVTYFVGYVSPDYYLLRRLRFTSMRFWVVWLLSANMRGLLCSLSSAHSLR
jgi:hypothetical protein